MSTYQAPQQQPSHQNQLALLPPNAQPESQTSLHSMQTRSKSSIFKPKALLASHIPLTDREPENVTEALNCSVWNSAMQEEYKALQNTKTWSLVPLPAGRRAIGCKWVFRIKKNADGTIQSYKARLVAKGFHQQQGFDFDETCSPVVKPSTIRVVLTLALSKGWNIRQLDVNNAFLNGCLHEEVYMEQPSGFEHRDKNLVCKLQKSLYGLKQAPRAWFEKLASTLCMFGFQSSLCDYSLFIRITPQHTTYILVYVDDILITGSSAREVQSLIQGLNQIFALKDLGDLSYFLGIEVQRLSNESLHLSHVKYIKDLLAKAKMQEAMGISTPMVSGAKLSKHGDDVFGDPKLYRSIVGALRYATITRPEISFSVNKVCQYMHLPLETHWKIVKRILRYLNGTLQHGLVIHKSCNLSLTAFCDEDWASDIDDRRSIFSSCMFLGPNLISWSSKKQRVVSRSTTEAEYQSLANTVSELIWLKALLSELKFSPRIVPTIYCDNSSGVQMAANPVYHARSRHIELDLLYVREKVLKKEILVCHVNSENQVADIFTKVLSKTRFCDLRNKLNILEAGEKTQGDEVNK